MGRAIYVYWFVSDNELSADHLQRMWWMTRDLVRSGTLQRWAYVGCLTFCAPGQEEGAYQRMKQWIAAAVPEFQLTPAMPGGRLASMDGCAALGFSTGDRGLNRNF